MQFTNLKKRHFEQSLVNLCRKPGFEFKTDVFRKLLTPLVYLVVDARDYPLYIGSTNRGLARLGSKAHKKLIEAIEHGANVLLYPTDTVETARSLERLLIRCLKPTLNSTPMNWREIDDGEEEKVG